MKVVTPNRPGWLRFTKQLWIKALHRNPANCTGRGTPEAYRHTRKILAKLGLDVERNIQIFQRHGGHCDCTILFNVEHSFKVARKQGLDPRAPDYEELIDKRITAIIEQSSNNLRKNLEKMEAVINQANNLLAKYDDRSLTTTQPD